MAINPVNSPSEPNGRKLVLDNLQARWADYFMESADADDIADELRAAGLQDRLLGPDEHVLLSPVTISADEVADYAAKLDQLGQVAIKVIAAHWDSDGAHMLQQMGYPAEAADVLAMTGMPKIMPFGRWDAIATSQGLRVLELNVGGATAGQDDRLMQRIYDRVSPAMSGNRHTELQAAPFEALRRLLPTDIADGIVVSDDDDELARSPISAQIAARSLSQLTGLDVPIVPASELFADGVSRSVVFELFTLRDCLSHPARYATYLAALSRGDFVSINPVQNDLLMNKATLALIYQAMTDDALTASEAELVSALLPWTVTLSPRNREDVAQRPRQQTVLKAANGYGGLDVHCGWTMTDAAWDGLLDKATSGDAAFVAQQRVDGDMSPLVAMSPQGAFIAFDAVPVLGVFCDGDQYGGGFARASINGDAVVNAHNGAVVGAIRVGGE